MALVDKKRKITNLILAVVLLAVAFAAVIAVPTVFANEDPPPDPAEIDREVQEGVGDDTTAQSDEEDGWVESIVQNVTNFVFDTSSLFDLLNRTLTAIVQNSYSQVMRTWEEPVNFSLLYAVSYSSDGLESVPSFSGVVNLADKIYPYWRVGLTVAVTFFPLILIANIAQAYTSGSSAPVVRAEMLQSLVYSLLRFGFVAASWWATNIVIKISWGLAEQIALVSVGPSGREIAKVLTKLIITGAIQAINPNHAIFWFYVLLFFFFLAVLLVVALMLSHYAFISLAAIFVVISPVVIAIGSLPFFNWLYGTWLKIITGLLMLPVANVLIFKLAFAILPLQGGTGTMVKMFTALGVIGVLTGVNFAIGKYVFAPVLQAAKRAGNSMLALGKLAASAAGMLAGGTGFAAAAGGMLGGVQGNGGGKGGTLTPADGGENPASGVISSSAASGTQQTALSTGRLNALRRKADRGELTHVELAGAKADWNSAKQAARTSLASRDPLLQGALGAFSNAKASPVDRQFAELEGMLWDQGSEAGKGFAGDGDGSMESSQTLQVAWRSEQISSRWRWPGKPEATERMMQSAQMAFLGEDSKLRDSVVQKAGSPGFQENFEGLILGSAAMMANAQGMQHQVPWTVDVDPAAGRELMSRSAEFFGGYVQGYVRNVLSYADAKAQHGQGSAINSNSIADYVHRFTRRL
ncbi:hypothetical protein KQH40_00955 [bacterium]|nr:hypothetical protein [bacterium]